MKLLVGQLNTVFRRTCRCNCSVSGVLSPAYLTLNNSSQDLCHYNDNCRTSVYCVVILLFGFYAPATEYMTHELAGLTRYILLETS
jgi:hypothetical protein